MNAFLTIAKAILAYHALELAVFALFTTVTYTIALFHVILKRSRHEQ